MDAEGIERYDRQIRLWGQHGQSKCSTSKICLINADSLGMEVLKGLCLAGIGSFAILDSHKLAAEDVGCSFLPPSCIGKSRGESVKTILLDMNDEVDGAVYPLETYLPHSAHRDEDLDTAERPDLQLNFWKQFTCIIASGFLYTNQIVRLSKICLSLNIPFISCRSIGCYGKVRNQLKEHIVAETHPDWRPPNYDPNKPESLVISTKPIYEEYDLKNKTFLVTGDDSEDEFITIYVCLNALDLFFSKYGRVPGCSYDQVETDVALLKESVRQIVGKLHIQMKSLDQCLYELCRYGGLELHTTSAFTGGCVAQEVIKLITNQYTPVNDCLIYNAMTGTTRSFTLSDIFSQS